MLDRILKKLKLYRIKGKLSCVLFPYYKFFKTPENFEFQGMAYTYFYHWYNATWTNERSVEIPIIMNMVKKYFGKNILEVGNVLPHYYCFSHGILDKYEKAKNVINADVLYFKPYIKYDLIVSVSTLEHVGWDEIPKNKTKIIDAVNNLKDHLSSSGKIIVTLPIGYNFEMDKLIKEDKLHFTKKFYLIRILKNKWREASQKEAFCKKYGHPFDYANGLIIGIIEK